MKHVTVAETTFMDSANSKSTTKPRGRPIHQMLVSFSAAYFAGALVTDLAYWQTPDELWERFSIWLITAGLIVAGVAVIAYVIDLAGGRQIAAPAWPQSRAAGSRPRTPDVEGARPALRLNRKCSRGHLR